MPDRSAGVQQGNGASSVYRAWVEKVEFGAGRLGEGRMSVRCLFGFHDVPYVSWVHTGAKYVQCKRCKRRVRNPN